MNSNDESYFQMPENSSRIYVMYDAPHMIKCIRNNWINLKNLNMNFHFPDFQIKGSDKFASFKLIRDIYHCQKNQIIKTGYTFNFQSLYPKSIERQKAKPALNIFNEKSSSAIRTFSTDGIFSSTADFSELITKFWNILNISTKSKYIHKNNIDLQPFYSEEDSRLEFLLKFAVWLEKWRNTAKYTEKLSTETFYSLIFTSRSIVSLIRYLLKNLKLSYILTSKFQTDCLEARIGLYRQASGANYHISMKQIIEAEKKIRTRNFIILNDKKVFFQKDLFKLERENDFPLPHTENNVKQFNRQCKFMNLLSKIIDNIMYK